MKKLLAAFFIFLSCATAQAQFNNCLPGFCAPDVASGPTPPLLDLLAAPATGGMSTKKLRAAYLGSSMQVKRSSDSATQDIGFDVNNNLDTVSMAAFCGVDTCTVNIWYDQVGAANGVPATANQPRIMVGGVIDTLINPAVRFGATANSCFNYTSGVVQPTTIALAANHITQVTNGHYTDGQTGVPRQLIGVSGAPPTQYSQYAGSASIVGGTMDTLSHAIIGIFNGAGSSVIVDGVTIITGNPGTNSMSTMVIGAGDGGAAPCVSMNGLIGEYIWFASGIGVSDQAIIRANWQAYWGTP